jgi:hypothetical protein
MKKETFNKILKNGRSKNKDNENKEVTTFTHWDILWKKYISNHVAYEHLKG